MSVTLPAVSAPPHPKPLQRLTARLGASVAVSVVTTGWSLSILAGLTATDLVRATVANVIATVTGIPWSYFLNRRYVWRRRHRSDLRREVLPFVAMCVVALVCSTAAVGLADRWAAGHDLAGLERTIVLVGASIFSFGTLWVAQFLLLDRVLFAARPVVLELLDEPREAHEPCESHESAASNDQIDV